jgi:hypothetical protein
MTAIACWIQNEQRPETPQATEQFLWAVGDSRVSDQSQDQDGNRTFSTLHDSAVKIFSIPVLVRSRDTTGLFSTICYFSSIGLAYSGSSLTGHNIVSATTPLLGSLITLDASVLPKLSDIARLVGRIADNYIRSFGFASTPLRAYSEMSVLGFCPVLRKAQIFLVKPVFTPDFSIDVQEFNQPEEGAFLLLGDKKNEITQLIDDERKLHSPGSIKWWRSPSHVIKRCIVDQQFPTIGGHIQLGIGTRLGFNIKWTPSPLEEGNRKLLLPILASRC